MERGLCQMVLAILLIACLPVDRPRPARSTPAPGPTPSARAIELAWYEAGEQGRRARWRSQCAAWRAALPQASPARRLAIERLLDACDRVLEGEPDADVTEALERVREMEAGTRSE